MKFIALLALALLLWALETFLGFCCPNAMSNDLLFMQVNTTTVSNYHDVVWLLAHMFILGQISSLGARILNSLVQVADKTIHKFGINCGMKIGICINGATNPLSAKIGEICPCCGLLLEVYSFYQYHLRCVSVQSWFSWILVQHSSYQWLFLLQKWQDYRFQLLFIVFTLFHTFFTPFVSREKEKVFVSKFYYSKMCWYMV